MISEAPNPLDTFNCVLYNYRAYWTRKDRLESKNGSFTIGARKQDFLCFWFIKLVIPSCKIYLDFQVTHITWRTSGHDKLLIEFLACQYAPISFTQNANDSFLGITFLQFDTIPSSLSPLLEHWKYKGLLTSLPR